MKKYYEIIDRVFVVTTLFIKLKQHSNVVCQLMFFRYSMLRVAWVAQATLLAVCSKITILYVC